MDATFLAHKHRAGLAFDAYVHSGTPVQYENWRAVHEKTALTQSQRTLIASFTRRIYVIALTGIWCGDCVQQLPLIDRIAHANPQAIDVRYLDRDAHLDLQAQVKINGGNRVPVLLFCAEDYELVGWVGDRTLSRYRAVAARQLGPSCPLPGAPIDANELAATVQDWVDEFERVHLLLRLSARLRQKHGD
jgi:thiol-disulfide isomerase/thioredoxin